MSDYYVDYDGNISTKKKKKKQNKSTTNYSVDYDGNITKKQQSSKPFEKSKSSESGMWAEAKRSQSKKVDSDIAPTRDKSGYFQKSAYFDDGYQKWDVAKTAGATAADVGENVAKGGANWLERLWDGLLTLGVKTNESAMMQAAQNEMLYNAISGNDESVTTTIKKYTKAQDEAEKEVAKYVAKNIIKEDKIDFGVDKYSVLGEKSDALVQSGTDLLIRQGIKAIPYVGVPLAYASTGLTVMGGEAESALNQGSTLDQAFASGMWSAATEIGTEAIFGGIKIGKNTLTDSVIKKATSKIPSKTLSTLAKWGINTVGEGAEEDLSGYLSAVGQKFIYLNEKEIDEIFTSEDHWDNFLK